jgi:pimeloyl-ACP methyl ester carboxylesterase
MNGACPIRRRLGLWTAVLTAIAAFGMDGCNHLPRPATVPMPAQLDKSACDVEARTLLVILPGRGMTLRELEKEGFVSAIRRLHLAVDVLRVDAHLGYYRNRSILERLRNDVIAPAQAQGYRSIWLAGISIGGFGALRYAEVHPADVQGILVLAPYLGEPEASQAILQAGGLLRWKAPPDPLPDDELAPRAWRSVQSLLLREEVIRRPPLYLGYGLSDSLAPSHEVLAQALPSGRVFTAPGGHDWDPWRGLWQRMLAATELPRC